MYISATNYIHVVPISFHQSDHLWVQHSVDMYE